MHLEGYGQWIEPAPDFILASDAPYDLVHIFCNATDASLEQLIVKYRRGNCTGRNDLGFVAQKGFTPAFRA